MLARIASTRASARIANLPCVKALAAKISAGRTQSGPASSIRCTSMFSPQSSATYPIAAIMQTMPKAPRKGRIHHRRQSPISAGNSVSVQKIGPSYSAKPSGVSARRSPRACARS